MAGALITEWKREGEANHKYVVMTKRNAFAKAYFKDPIKLKRETLETWFLDARVQNDEDVVKLALVYVVACLLLHNYLTVSLPKFFVNLVDNLNKFNNYLWGKLVWEDSTVRPKKQAHSKNGKFECGVSNSHYNLFGFHLSLQVWLYKTFLDVTVSFVTKAHEVAIPRMLGWVPAEHLMFARVEEVLFSVSGDELSSYSVKRYMILWLC